MIKNKMIKIITILSIAILLLILTLIFNIFDSKTMLLKCMYPIKYSEYVEEYAEEFNVDKYLIYSMIKIESNFNEKAKSRSKAKGLMQLMDETAFELMLKLENNASKDEEYILKPEINIKLGTYYISSLIKKYRKSWISISSI